MAAGVAHEVRNPLGVIRSSAELLTDMAGADPDAADAGRFIVEEVDRLDGLVRSILDFSRPLVPERSDTALSEVVRRAARLADRPTEVEGDAAAAVDPDLLVQAVLTMLVNARQAGAERVVARIRGGRAVLAVEIADDGPGVPDSARVGMFEPFHTTREGAGGTGLGLAMAQRIAQAHGGLVAYRDGAGLGPGGSGACFRMELPVAEPVDARMSA